MKILKAPFIFLIISVCISCEKKPFPPDVLTSNATAISATSAISGGIVMQNGNSPVIMKGICWNTTNDPTVDHNKTVVAEASMSYSGNITGLLPATIYYVRAFAANKTGISYGESKSFKTLGGKPVSWLHSASNIQTTSATLAGIINPNSLETIITFEYGVSTSYGFSEAALQNPVSGDSNENVTADLTGLLPGTTYHFRVKAENSLGITFSNDMTFKTAGRVPIINACEAKNIELTSVVLNGTVNPNSLETLVKFEYGLTMSYGNSITASQNPLSGQAYENITADLTGLNPGTTYHYRIKAENLLGTIYSADATFTTKGRFPSVILCGSQNITLNSVTLNTTLNPNYLSTDAVFEWGTTTAYGNTISPVVGTLNGHDAVDITVDIKDLDPGTTYHYRVKASNLLGTTISEDMVFSTNFSDIEDNIYRTVTIGTQLWMSENLRTTKYNNGTLIPLVENNDQWRMAVDAAYCWYNNDPGNKYLCGALYNRYAVELSQNGHKNICPVGWHVPTQAEWTILFDYLSQNGYGFGGNNPAIAKSLASASGWETAYAESQVGFNQSANNSSGFNGFPAGIRLSTGNFTVYGLWAGWWAQPDNYMLSYIFGYNVITHDNSIVKTIPFGLNYGSPVRCMKD